MDHTTPDPRHTLSSPPRPDRRRLGAPLPASLTPLIGRAADIAAAAGLIAHGTRLITLTGPGGVGKTSLALAVAAELDGAFPDGCCLVALSAILDPTLVVPTIIQSLEPRAVVGDSPVDQLAEMIGERRLLLLLDNMEQVLDAGPSLARLLAACPNLTILATSRVVLRLSGEHVVPVAPLPVPNPNAANDLTHIATYGAIDLFAQRARAADPGFALSSTNAPVIADIVRRLDGLPLAIELAADRVRTLPPEVILARLDDRLRLLTGGARDRHDRQRTMRDTIAWSYDLLSPRGKALCRRLGVFVGGFPLEAVEPVAGLLDETDDVVDSVTALVDASLLRRVDHPGAPRYAMLETVRAYAREQLVASGEEAKTCAAHAEWCIGLADIANFGQQADVPPDALERLPPEHDNLRAALAWAIGRGETEIALRLVAACIRFWFMFAHFREGRLWASRALSLPGDASSHFRGRALNAHALMSSRLGELDEAFRLAEDGLAIVEAAGDQVGRGRALGALGFIATQSGDYSLAATRAEELLDLTRALGDRVWEQRVLSDLGMLAFTRGDTAQAIALYETALPLVRALDDRALVMHLVGNLAIFYAHQGELRHSAEFRREALSHARQLGLPDGIAKALSDTAESAVHAGLVDAGARLLGASNALRAAANVPEIRTGLDDLARLDALFHARMDEATYRAAQDAGAAMPLDAAVAEADRILAGIIDAPDRERAARPVTSGALTPRELDVVRLLAAGKSNREIADALYIGHSTAITHVRHVLHKLDLDSRAAVAAWAVRHGLD